MGYSEFGQEFLASNAKIVDDWALNDDLDKTRNQDPLSYYSYLQTFTWESQFI